MTTLAGKLEALAEFTEANIEQAFASTLEEHKIKDERTSATGARCPDRVNGESRHP